MMNRKQLVEKSIFNTLNYIHNKISIYVHIVLSVAILSTFLSPLKVSASKLKTGKALSCKNIILGKSKVNKEQKVKRILAMFEFPKKGEYSLKNKVMRKAIYKAYDGKDFFTGEKMSIDQMSIDHIIPRSKGGKDNIYNYVPTTGRLNAAKSSEFDEVAAIATLSIVRTVYAPKVFKEIQALHRVSNLLKLNQKIVAKRINKETEALALEKQKELEQKSTPKKMIAHEFNISVLNKDSLVALVLLHQIITINSNSVKLNANQNTEVTLYKSDISLSGGFEKLSNELSKIKIIKSEVYENGDKIDIEVSSVVKKIKNNSNGNLVLVIDSRFASVVSSYSKIDKLIKVLSSGSFKRENIIDSN